MADEVIAVFKADIEQFKAQMAELGVKVGAVQAQVDATTVSTEKFTGKTKSASSSISALSKGLGGVTGLLGITGRLFGVNTDKIQALVFASQQFAKVGQDIAKAQKLATAATQAGTAATITQTTAERILNAVRSAGVAGIGLVIAGLVAVGVAIAKYISFTKEAEAAELERQKASDGTVIKNDEIRASYNKLIIEIRDLGVEYDVLTGKITESEGVLRTLKNTNEDAINDIKNNTKKQLEETKTFTEKFFEFLGIESQEGWDRIRVIETENNALLNKQKEANAVKAAIEQAKIDKKKREAADAAWEAEKKRIISRNEATFQLALKEFEALKKLGQSSESPIERETREHEERLKNAGIFGRSVSDLTEFEHAALLREEQDFQDKLNVIIQAGLDEQQKLRDAAFKLEEETQKEEDDAFLKNKDIAQKKTLELAKKGNKEALEILKITDADAAAAIQKEIDDKRIAAAQEVADTIFKAQQEAFDKRQELLAQEVTDQQTKIETQRRLAEAGLANTLAFEEKRAADLRRQQQQEAERQKKIKLLETFLNSLAEFSKTDPKNAISKALLQVALAQAASAVFAEEGGIIGEIGHASNLRRRHKGGGDVLLHAQTGEGILSRREMDNLGKRNFHLLKDAARFPIRDDVFGMPKIAMAGGVSISNAEVVKEIQSLHKTMRNFPRESWEVNKFGEYIKTSIENGVTEVTKGKMPKPRFK